MAHREAITGRFGIPSSQRENHQRPNEAVLTPQPGGHDIHQQSTLPTDRQRHDLSSGLHVQEQPVLIRRRLPTHHEFAGWLTPRTH
jgi:hypothetical protein